MFSLGSRFPPGIQRVLAAEAHAQEALWTHHPWVEATWIGVCRGGSGIEVLVLHCVV